MFVLVPDFMINLPSPIGDRRRQLHRIRSMAGYHVQRTLRIHHPEAAVEVESSRSRDWVGSWKETNETNVGEKTHVALPHVRCRKTQDIVDIFRFKLAGTEEELSCFDVACTPVEHQCSHCGHVWRCCGSSEEIRVLVGFLTPWNRVGCGAEKECRIAAVGSGYPGFESDNWPA